MKYTKIIGLMIFCYANLLGMGQTESLFTHPSVAQYIQSHTPSIEYYDEDSLNNLYLPDKCDDHALLQVAEALGLLTRDVEIILATENQVSLEFIVYLKIKILLAWKKLNPKKTHSKALSALQASFSRLVFMLDNATTIAHCNFMQLNKDLLSSENSLARSFALCCYAQAFINNQNTPENLKIINYWLRAVVTVLPVSRQYTEYNQHILSNCEKLLRQIEQNVAVAY